MESEERHGAEGRSKPPSACPGDETARYLQGLESLSLKEIGLQQREGNPVPQ